MEELHEDHGTETVPEHEKSGDAIVTVSLQSHASTSSNHNENAEGTEPDPMQDKSATAESGLRKQDESNGVGHDSSIKDVNSVSQDLDVVQYTMNTSSDGSRSRSSSQENPPANDAPAIMFTGTETDTIADASVDQNVSSNKNIKIGDKTKQILDEILSSRKSVHDSNNDIDSLGLVSGNSSSQQANATSQDEHVRMLRNRVEELQTACAKLQPYVKEARRLLLIESQDEDQNEEVARLQKVDGVEDEEKNTQKFNEDRGPIEDTLILDQDKSIPSQNTSTEPELVKTHHIDDAISESGKKEVSDIPGDDRTNEQALEHQATDTVDSDPTQSKTNDEPLDGQNKESPFGQEKTPEHPDLSDNMDNIPKAANETYHANHDQDTTEIRKETNNSPETNPTQHTEDVHVLDETTAREVLEQDVILKNELATLEDQLHSLEQDGVHQDEDGQAIHASSRHLFSSVRSSSRSSRSCDYGSNTNLKEKQSSPTESRGDDNATADASSKTTLNNKAEEINRNIIEIKQSLQSLQQERERANSVEEAEDLDSAIATATEKLHALQQELDALGPTPEEIAAREEEERRKREEKELIEQRRQENMQQKAAELLQRRKTATAKLLELRSDHDGLHNQNAILQANLAEMLRKRFKDQKPMMKQGEARIRYQGILKDLAKFGTEHQETKLYFESELERLKSLKESRQASVHEAWEKYSNTRRNIALQIISGRTGKRLRVHEFNEMDQAYEQKELELAASRRKHYRLKATLEQTQHELEEKDKLSGGLHLIDFEQLKIENQAFNEKIEERNEELIRLKRRMSNMVQILTHVKEKLSFTDTRHRELSDELHHLDSYLSRERAELTQLKKAKDKLYHRTASLTKQTALLHRPHVVRAFEQEHDQQVSLKHTLSVLEDQRQQTLSETLRLTRRIRSQASSASSSRLDQPML